MWQNIKKNHTKKFDAKLYSGHYYDYMLYKGETYVQTIDDINDMAIADFSSLNIIDGVLYSTVTWKNAVCADVVLNDIGLTGVDNGLISYDKDKISNREFLQLFLHSKKEIEDGDVRMFMTPVTGNTKLYSYPMYLVDDDDGSQYIAFKGGFYQGFFKLDGFDYQVLPSSFTNDIVMHFELRPRSDYDIDNSTVNTIHPENSGIFFFMGTRAENKFWPLYGVDSGTTCEIPLRDDSIDSYLTDCDGYISDYLEPKCKITNVTTWLDLESACTNCDITSGNNVTSGNTITEILNDPFDDDFLKIYDFFPDKPCECETSESYIINPKRTKNQCNKSSINTEYIQDDIGTIDFKDLTDSAGHQLNLRGYYELSESDNKFLMFDRTETGFTTNNWVEGSMVKLTGKKHFPDINYFLVMNRTETGYTTNNITEYYEQSSKDYNIYKDLRNNVFALRVNENGAIGYRYGVTDCSDENDNKYKIIEEYSKDGMVKSDEWNSINVRFAIINRTTDKCDKTSKKMRIMFYVNGFLKFISKELPALSFKRLDEVSEKQEAVPYSISLGGGSIGLLETITPDYYEVSKYIMPIERDFCGTFIGDVRSFIIYEGFMPYSSILNYLSKTE